MIKHGSTRAIRALIKPSSFHFNGLNSSVATRRLGTYESPEVTIYGLIKENKELRTKLNEARTLMFSLARNKTSNSIDPERAKLIKEHWEEHNNEQVDLLEKEVKELEEKIHKLRGKKIEIIRNLETCIADHNETNSEIDNELKGI